MPRFKLAATITITRVLEHSACNLLVYELEALPKLRRRMLSVLK